MSDDTENAPHGLFRSSPVVSVYAELYPSFPRRLAEAERSLRPEIRKRVAALAEARSRNDARRQAHLTRALGLTPTEVRLALHLAHGGTIAGYARQFGVTQSTARSQLKSVFAKTGVNRQASLVAMLRGG
jgi:DNA-binding CsgD family transcriptional regulator